MSKVSIIMCDCCRKEITGKPDEPNLALIVAMPRTKIVTHYCWQCAVQIIDTINKITVRKGSEQE